MAARIVEGLFTCLKRWALEEALAEAGHRWRRRPGARDPMSGVECLARILCWLDGRGDPLGRMFDATPRDIERAAGWTGKPGLLVEALLATEWLDADPEGLRWHDYAALNRLTLYDRARKQQVRGDGKGDKSRDRKRDNRGDRTRTSRGTEQGQVEGQNKDKRGASESESGDPQRIPETLRAGARAPQAPSGGAPGAAPPRGKAERTPEQQQAYREFVREKVAACRNLGIEPNLPPGALDEPQPPAMGAAS